MKTAKRTYATVSESEGIDYRTMADAMTSIGFKMNHSSARNHVLRVMKKFAAAYAEAMGAEPTEEMLEAMSKSAAFQGAVAEYIAQL